MRRLNKNNNGGGMAAQSQSAPSKRRQVSARALPVGDNALTCLLWFREVPMHHEENCEVPQILLITFQGEWKLCVEGPTRGTSAVFCVGINKELVTMRN